jgi:hypothetical protein
MSKQEQEKWRNNFVWEDGRATLLFRDSRFKKVVLRALDEYDIEFFVRLGAMVSDRISILRQPSDL